MNVAPAAATHCEWCGASLVHVRRGQRWCTKRCRQSGHRLKRRGHQVAAKATEPGRFAYSDSPYLGFCGLYGHDHGDGSRPWDGGCWNDLETHRVLIASLIAGDYLGFGLSASAKSLYQLLPLFPPSVVPIVHPWVKPLGVPRTTAGAHNRWEPLIVVGGRRLKPGVRDWLRAMPARGGGRLLGRKPAAFAAWMFALLGMRPGDQLDDLFPGSGIIGRAWTVLSSRTPATERVSPLVERRQLPLYEETADGPVRWVVR